MDYYKLNDFELIYLIKEDDELALNIMFEKYAFLISKNIKRFNLLSEYEDMYQEGLMVLHKSLLVYDEEYKKTFTKFFEHNLQNRFITLVKNKQKKFKIERIDGFLLKEDISKYSVDETDNINFSVLTQMEYKVFVLRIEKKHSIEKIAQEMNLTKKEVYNALGRAKQKIKQQIG